MLFNSIDFAVFLPIVFALYWLLNRYKLELQNFLIVVASYVFYGWWDWRFLTLIFASTLIDYILGLAFKYNKTVSYRRIYLFVSIIVNLGLLGFFKYYNFFVENFVIAFRFFGTEINPGMLNIILPVGISFYTFQTLSYTIDIYKRKQEPTTDFVSFAAFVSFFPQLVAGPIERATNLLPQFQKKRIFNYNDSVNGLRQILWGLFKKIVIADNCAIYANMIFEDSANLSGSSLLIGAFCFAFQIYGDFSGYSDIAIGTARLFGFNLMQNFAFPYFSRDIAEFWRRWHISLSTWFRDYLYIPLGGSRGNVLFKMRNLFIIFIVSGFWHGANWTYIMWGFVNALYFLPLMLLNKNRHHLDVVAKGKYLPSFKDLINIGLTFFLTLIAWVFFRAENMQHAWEYLSTIFSSSLFSYPEIRPRNVFALVAMFSIVEWIGRDNQYGIEKIGMRWKRPFRWLFYYLIMMIILYFVGEKQEFIYFQF